jgi:hypothetical protein
MLDRIRALLSDPYLRLTLLLLTLNVLVWATLLKVSY